MDPVEHLVVVEEVRSAAHRWGRARRARGHEPADFPGRPA